MLAQLEDQQAAARGEDADRLGDGAVRIGGVVQRLRQQREVDAAASSGSSSSSPRFHVMLAARRRCASVAGPGQHGRRAIDADHVPGPARRLDGQIALAAAEVGDPQRRQEQAERARPGRPAPSRLKVSAKGL